MAANRVKSSRDQLPESLEEGEEGEQGATVWPLHLLLSHHANPTTMIPSSLFV